MKKTIKRGLQYGVMILWTCVCIGPFVWILLSSFKPLREITSWPPTLWPQNFTLDNYVEAWNTIPYGRYLLNSLLVSSVSTLSVVLVACLAAYSLVVLKSRLSRLVEHILGGALVTFLCMVFYHLGLGHNVSSMIIGSVIPMIPGVAFTNAIRDLTDGDYIAGSVRMMDTALVVLGIALGVGMMFTAYYRITGGNLL